MKNTAPTYTVQSANYVTIANAIFVNTDELLAGRIDKATWKVNQDALWAEATRQNVLVETALMVMKGEL